MLMVWWRWLKMHIIDFFISTIKNQSNLTARFIFLHFSSYYLQSTKQVSIINIEFKMFPATGKYISDFVCSFQVSCRHPLKFTNPFWDRSIRVRNIWTALGLVPCWLRSDRPLGRVKFVHNDVFLLAPVEFTRKAILVNVAKYLSEARSFHRPLNKIECSKQQTWRPPFCLLHGSIAMMTVNMSGWRQPYLYQYLFENK